MLEFDSMKISHLYNRIEPYTNVNVKIPKKVHENFPALFPYHLFILVILKKRKR